MPFAIRFHQTGGPEVLRWEEVAVGDPAPGEARVRHQAVGLNFIDTYHRSGLYPLPLPSGLGTEAAGIIEAVGAGVTDLQVGDRVAYAGGPLGAYSQERCLPADRLLKLPAAIDCRTGAAMMLQGLTAAYIDPLIGGSAAAVVPYIFMLVVLVIRPTGMFGWKRIERV